ncbi:MAG: aspartate aminotransferase family protein [Oscillospiraceae bacterium]|jgi:4-aminobutyrate aminotransferase/(S)-3-amino-2-methylpropionate transaminase|nr:aspartate aminotransferase family protein [Oscillospiraceae bacterium]
MIDIEELRVSLPQVVGELPGPKAASILQRRQSAIPAPVRSVYPVVIAQGAGAMVEDVDGNRFLDWVGGVGVLNLGYSHPALIEAVQEQAGKYFHSMMNITTHEGYITLAEKLNARVPLKEKDRRTFFCNSGAEAVENAVKIARGATHRPNIIVFSGAFHGRTLLAGTMTSKKAYYHGMGPLPDGVYRAQFPYLYRAPKGYSEDEAIAFYLERLQSVFEEASYPEDVAAIVVEPVQGEGGFIPAPKAWVLAVRQLCDKHGILLVADEVQTGFARSGKLFVSNYWSDWGAAPDIVTMAKSIAAGVPLAAVTVAASVVNSLPPGTIGTTYGGNALATASALQVLEAIEKQDLCNRAAIIGERVTSTYTAWQAEIPAIGDVRGIGAMLGMELVHPDGSPWPELVNATVQNAVKRGLIIESAGTYGNVIRFLCPLVVTDAQLEAGLGILKEALLGAL